MLPMAFFLLGMPVVVLLTNRRFPYTDAGDLGRFATALVSGVVLAALGYLVAMVLSGRSSDDEAPPGR